ncbi:MAG: radical SAM protein [Bacteroidetes bacterium]|nr:radical SAM protein [Bacteroidota bacterium]
MNNAYIHSKPSNLFIEITTECNYRCKYCHLWKTKERAESIQTEEKVRLIKEFKSLNKDGEVILTGGETMLKLEEFFKLSRICLELELGCIANTNSSFINENIIDRLLVSGPSLLVISLDSHMASIHDYGRGVKGSFDKIIDTIRGILKQRSLRYPQSHLKLYTSSVIYDRNIHLIPDFIKFAEGLNLDGILFQMLDKTFANSSLEDSFFEKHFFQDVPDACNHLAEITNIRERHPIVVTSEQDFHWMIEYIKNPYSLDTVVCGSYERNIMVDSYGDVSLCFNMKELTNGRPIGNVRKNSLYELWNNSMAIEMRTIMSQCQRTCGMLNCHRKRSFE